MPLKKRPFILFELFCALALISLSIFSISSYPLKMYQKELSLLIELQLEEMSELAFRDLLLDLSSYIDPETLEPYTETPEKIYTVELHSKYKWNYLATWKLKCKTPDQKDPKSLLLSAKLTFIPQDKAGNFIKLPPQKQISYKYFIEKKPSASQGEANGKDKIV